MIPENVVHKVLQIATLGVALTLVACTSEQTYGAGQAWQRNECKKHSKLLG
jgi:hypothetical protein